ncbi:chorismate mutase [Lacticaseibacillus sp. N501-2]|uniref:chorismate mutase n=1 Tax=Lacticaseibacillus salsurae TaxID=3367729 RepID=UPI0038B2D290
MAVDSMIQQQAQAGLAHEREQINAIDQQIAALLAKRFETVDRIAQLKQTAGVPVKNLDREAQVLDSVAQAIGAKELAPHARKIFATIMAESRAYQTQKIHAEHMEEN